MHTSPMSDGYRPLGADDLPSFARLQAQAFNVPVPPGRVLAVDQYRGLFEEDRLRAVLRLRPTRQYFGGRALPAVAVSSVAVDLDARRKGYGGRLLREALAEMAADGVALSTLHPTAVGAYRSVGYELAGSRIRYRVPVQELPRVAVGEQVAISSVPAGDAAGLAACYEAFARETNGLLARAESSWTESLPGGSSPLSWLVAEADGHVTGYAAYRQTKDGQGTAGEEADYRFSIDCRDFVYLDDRSARSLMSAFAGQAPLATTFSWVGPSADPLLALFPSGRPGVEVEQRWMSRVVNVRAALTSRGWPLSAQLDLAIELYDPVLQANTRTWRLRLREGEAQLEPGGEADVSMDVGALASLLTGWASPRGLARIGRVRASDRHLDAMAGAFAGSAPYLFEWF